VTCKVTRIFEWFARELDIRLEDVTVELPISTAKLRDPSERMDWDVFAALMERFGERFGAERAEELGERVVFEEELSEPLKRFGRAVASPERIYMVATSFLASSWFRNLSVDVEKLATDRLQIQARVPPSYLGSPWYFRHVTGSLRAIPAVLDLPPADVVAHTGPHGGRWIVSAPRAPLHARLSVLPRMLSAARLVDDFSRQQQSLNAAFMDNLRAAEALRASERRFEALLGGVGEIIAIVDATGRVKWVNRAVESVLGVGVVEITGSDAFRFVEPDDLERIRSAFAQVLSGTRAPGIIRVRAARRQGGSAELEVTLKNLCDDPEVRGVVVNARDVTEHRRTEAELRSREQAYAALLENVRGMAYRTRSDVAHELTLVSDGCEALTGFTPEELVGGTSFTSLVHPEDVALFGEGRRAALGDGGESSVEYRIRKKNGELRWVWDQAQGVADERGNRTVVEGLITDITDRRRLEEQLLQAQKMEGIGRLAGGIAHDFNNLLAVMLGYVDLSLKHLPKDEPVRANIEGIGAAGQRAADLTRQLLTFARRQVIAPQPLDPNLVVQGMASLLNRLLGDRVFLKLELGPVAGSIRADAAQIEQVVMNLAINARDAMPEGGRVTIRTGQVSLTSADAAAHDGAHPGPYFAVAVSDTGTGLSAEAQAHLFEPFFTTKPAGHGTGLGLATSYGVIKQAGGHFRVESEAGRGTTFHFYLPLLDVVTTRAAADPGVLESSAPATVLLVEDHDLVRGMIQRSLQSLGFHVLVADSGPSALALEAAHLGEIDLLLTDIMMPKMSGPELARELTRRRPTAAVLYMSGFAPDEVAREGVLEAGAPFLCKPFTTRALSERLREALDARVRAR